VQGCACRGGRRASGAGVAEKKIAILEQALRHHPGSDELLLALLAAVEVVVSGDDVEDRWRRVLAHHSGSARLWQAFLSWQRARFGTFSCSAMRVSYGDAIIVRTPLACLKAFTHLSRHRVNVLCATYMSCLPDSS
jgi:hypothetical protein